MCQLNQCCCCSLQTGTKVIGIISLVIIFKMISKDSDDTLCKHFQIGSSSGIIQIHLREERGDKKLNKNILNMKC